MEAQLEYIYTMHARFFCTFGADLQCQSVLINKISAMEFSRKFIKNALLVGQVQLYSDDQSRGGEDDPVDRDFLLT